MSAILWAIIIPILLFCILNLIFFYYAGSYRYSSDRLNAILTNHYVQNVKARPDGWEFGLFRVKDSRMETDPVLNIPVVKGTLYTEDMVTRNTFDFKDLIYPAKMFPQI